MSHKYSNFSWWWAHIRPKRVEKINKNAKKNCAPSWLYLQDYAGLHGEQNIKNVCMFVMAFFISVCFKDALVSACWRQRYSNLETCTSYIYDCTYKLYNSAFFCVTWVVDVAVMPVLLHVYNIMHLVGCNRYIRCQHSRWCNYASDEDYCIYIFSRRHWKIPR